MPIKEFKNETEILADTTKLQLASLDLFAQELGYVRDPVMNNYYCEHGNYRDKPVMSLMTIQAWHNNNFGKPFRIFEANSLQSNAERLKLNIDDMKSAIDAKLVVETRFQRKKNGELITQDHQVKFV